MFRVLLREQFHELFHSDRCLAVMHTPRDSGVGCAARQLSPDLGTLLTMPLLAPQALLETALTRVVLPMPILVLPPIVMSMLEK